MSKIIFDLCKNCKHKDDDHESKNYPMIYCNGAFREHGGSCECDGFIMTRKYKRQLKEYDHQN